MASTVGTRVVTGEVRLSYVYLAEPRESLSGDMEYSVVCLIPKSDTATMKSLRRAEEAAKEQGKARWGGKIPSNLKPSTIRDGDVEADLDKNPEYAGHYYMTAKSKVSARFSRPRVLDRNLQEILDIGREVYSGCYGRVSVTAAPYSASGSNGVSFWLNNVQKTRDGDRFAGGPRAEDEFGVLDSDDVI